MPPKLTDDELQKFWDEVSNDSLIAEMSLSDLTSVMEHIATILGDYQKEPDPHSNPLFGSW